MRIVVLPFPRNLCSIAIAQEELATARMNHPDAIGP